MPNSSHYFSVSTGKILVKSLRFYCERFTALFPPFLIVTLINSVLWKITFDLIPHFKIQPGFTENFLVQFINYLTFMIPLIVVFVLASWIIDAFPTGLVIKHSSDILEGRPPSLASSLKMAASKILSLLSIGLIRGLLVTLGLVLLVLPGIIMAIFFSLAIQVAIIEKSGTFESLQKSKKLASKRPWQVFSILLFVFILTALGGMIGEIVCNHLMIEGYIRWVIIGIFISVARPLRPIALTHLYYSLNADRKLIETREPFRPISSVPQRREQKLPEISGYHPKFCYKCGQKLPLDAVYCPRCGVRVKT